MRKIFLFFSVFFLVDVSAFADVIYLRNGQKVQGTILEDTGYSYKIMVDGKPKLYYINEVAKVTRGDEPAAGQGGQTGEAVSKEQREVILKLLEVTGARASMVRTFAGIVDKVPAQNRDAYAAVFNVDEVMPYIVPIYAKHFNEEELKALLAFYSSPLGVKHLEIAPVIMRETLEVVTKYFEEKGKALPAVK